MNPLKSKHYPRIMYLLLIVVSLLILFSMVNILENANNNLKYKSLTGFAINNNETNQTLNNPIKNITMQKTNEKQNPEQELYTSKPYMIFYIFLIGILMAITITFMILSSTIKKNIEQEERERKF